MKLPLLLADEACRGVRTDVLHMLAQPCINCQRRIKYLNGDDLIDEASLARPAAEWSDTTNEWRCGNRLPMEG